MTNFVFQTMPADRGAVLWARHGTAERENRLERKLDVDGENTSSEFLLKRTTAIRIIGFSCPDATRRV